MSAAIPAELPMNRSRLLSLDALRGFNMFWIIGGEDIFHALHKISHAGIFAFLVRSLTHKDWEGFAPYDLIFPLFVFIVGVSLVFSLSGSLERAGRAATVRKIIRRAVLLYLIGIVYYGGIAEGIGHVRLLGVLQRIAIVYLFAGLLFVSVRPRTLVIVCLSLLVGYWALMTFVPVPGVGAGNFAQGQNLANYLDKHYLPLRKWDGDHDPEGLLSTLPAIATGLLGVFAGLLLRNDAVTKPRKVLWLLAAGIVAVALGWLWALQFPVIKKIWTSSYVLVAGGYSFLLLAVFYLVIDVWNVRRWAVPFVWIGVNPITLYLAAEFVNFQGIAKRFAGSPVQTALGNYGPLLLVCIGMTFVFALARFLYRRRIFVRL